MWPEDESEEAIIYLVTDISTVKYPALTLSHVVKSWMRDWRVLNIGASLIVSGVYCSRKCSKVPVFQRWGLVFHLESYKSPGAFSRSRKAFIIHSEVEISVPKSSEFLPTGAADQRLKTFWLRFHQAPVCVKLLFVNDVTVFTPKDRVE